MLKGSPICHEVGQVLLKLWGKDLCAVKVELTFAESTELAMKGGETCMARGSTVQRGGWVQSSGDWVRYCG